MDTTARMKNTLIFSAALALAGLAPAAFAHEAGGFLRGEVGRSDVDVSGGLSGSESDTSALIGGGYWFNPNFAIEGHVGTLYTEEFGADTDVDLVSIGVGIAAKKNFGPEGNGFFIGGRAGVARLTYQVRYDTFDVEEQEHATGAYVGASVGYDFNDRFGLSLNVDRRQADFNGADVDVDTVTVGGEYRF